MRSLHKHFASLAACLAAAALSGSAPAQTPIDANAGSPSPSSGLIPPRSLLQPAHGDWCDNFDRANNTVMGPDWTEWTGDMAILNNHGMGNLSIGWSYMLHTTASDTYADSTMEIDLLPPSGSSGPHVALIAGATAGSTSWFYTKIQDNNSDGSYDRIFFYSSGNGGGWGTQYFQDLTAPITTGHVKMHFTNSGDTLNVDIDADFNGTYEQHYQNSGASSVGIAGTGFGIGAWAMGAYDNWKINDGCPGGLNLALSGACGGQMTATVTGATPNGAVAIVRAFGTGSVTIPPGNPCAGTPLGLNSTASLAGTTNANSSGVAVLGPVNVPAGACGNVYAQALDVATCATSNVVLVQ